MLRHLTRLASPTISLLHPASIRSPLVITTLYTSRFARGFKHTAEKSDDGKDHTQKIEQEAWCKYIKYLEERTEIEEEMRREGNYGYWTGFSDEEIAAYKQEKAKRNIPKAG